MLSDALAVIVIVSDTVELFVGLVIEIVGGETSGLLFTIRKTTSYPCQGATKVSDPPPCAVPPFCATPSYGRYHSTTKLPDTDVRSIVILAIRV